MKQRNRIIVIILTMALLLSVVVPRRQTGVVLNQLNLVSIIQRVDPSVVYVEAYGTYEAYSYDEYGFDKQNDQKLWSGSGVIICPDGLVLTAAHVIEGADRFKVTLPDGQEFWSENAWHRSEISDIGFIQLDVTEKLPVSSLGKSNTLKRGEDVFVIGCPFGYDLRFTVTKGIVSGIKRDCDGYFGEKLMLQVDAASFPGNSGGPVYNMRGRIIGILVGGYSGGYDNIGLVIPVGAISGLLDMYMAEQVMKEIE